jgi:DNA repair protein RadC
MQAKRTSKKKKTGITRKKSGIALWAITDRPREKLMLKGPRALSEADLLAILLRIGRRDKNAVEIARELLRINQNDLNELGKRSIRQLMKINGIGLAKAVTIAAALELGRRRHSSSSLKKPIVKDSRTAAAYLGPLLEDYGYEVFVVLFLNQAGRIKQEDIEIVSQGGISSTVVDPRLIFKKALELDAVSLIVCHNHPSGNLQPSQADKNITSRLLEGAKYLDIKLLDHIIVGDKGYFSFADSGLLIT